MKNSRLSEFIYNADLFICSVWLLLIAHENICSWMVNPFMLICPALRIWINFLMYRQSKLTIVPTVMLTLMASCLILEINPGYHLFTQPWETLLTSAFALFSADFIQFADFQDISSNACKKILFIISYVWLVIYPLVVYIYNRIRKQLLPSSLGVWKCIGLCAYIFGCTTVASIVFSISYKTTLSMAVLAFTQMLIPAIFYGNNIKGMFTRREAAYLLTVTIFTVGYVCGVGLELKSTITVCVFPAALYTLVNWYVHRKTTYKDILLIVAASVLFWCAQYTSNMVRVLLLFASLTLTALPVIGFAVETKKHWKSAGLYIAVALIMPVFCLGYNPYSVLEASRVWHFDKYWRSPNGLLYVRNGNVEGLRDRYGVILPVEYDRIELLTPSKPYCKVLKENKWRIYDIERHEPVSDEWFEDVIPIDKYVYKLKSQNGDKYLTMHWHYDRYDKEQSALISNELPVKK